MMRRLSSMMTIQSDLVAKHQEEKKELVAKHQGEKSQLAAKHLEELQTEVEARAQLAAKVRELEAEVENIKKQLGKVLIMFSYRF